MVTFLKLVWRKFKEFFGTKIFPYLPKAWRETIIFVRAFWRKHKLFRQVVGILLIIIGVISLVTPATPGAWLIFIGLEVFGFKIAFWEKIKTWLRRHLSPVWKKIKYWFRRKPQA